MVLDQKIQAQKELGEKLKKAREELGFTQFDVAEKTKMTVNYYAMIERGEVDLTYTKIRQLFNVLKIDASELPL